jgi:hypothetical protein
LIPRLNSWTIKDIKVWTRLAIAIFGLWTVPGTPIFAQRLLDGPELDEVKRLFAHPPAKRVRCRVHWSRPTLDFGFRFVLPFEIYFPAHRFAGKDLRMRAALRVTPAGHDPVFISYSVRFRGEVPASARTNIELDAAILVGVGQYRIDLLLTDRFGRSCAARTYKDAAKPPELGNFRLSFPPNAVSALSEPPWERLESAAKAREGTLTILIHAQPPRPQASALRALERDALLGSVATLVRESGFSRFRVIAFNLDQQSEFFRNEDFTAQSFEDLAGALESLNLAQVQYSVLQKTRGYEDLLAQIVRKEWTQPDPSETVVILGWRAHVQTRIPMERLGPVPPRRPRFYYLNYESDPPSDAGHDTIDRLVADLGGDSRVIHNPPELADAIRWIFP